MTMTQPMTSRRVSLATLAGLATVSSAFTAAAAAAPFGNPDAELIEAWNGYLAQYRAMIEGCDEDKGYPEEPQREMDRLINVIWDTPAITLEGFLIKTRMMVVWASTSCAVLDHYAFGHRAPSSSDEDMHWDDADDETAPHLWDTIRETEEALGRIAL